MQVTQLRTEYRRLKIARNPISVESRFKQRIDDHNFAPSGLRKIEVLGEHRLVCRRVCTPNHDQVRRNDVFHRTRRCRNTDRCFQPHRRWRMAHTSRRIDRCNTHRTRSLPCGVIHLVRQPSTREVHPNPVGRGRTNCIGGER